jgi:predicted metal-binding membrane protein
MESDDASVPAQRVFLGVTALVFAISAAVTVVWCASMSGMGMEMPGGWMMSMAWLPMSGQSWPVAAASFLGMWIVMMVAMMLPSLVPVLGRYRRAAAGARESRLGWRTALVALGYFCVWTAVGVAVFPIGAALAALEMQSPALAHGVPFAVGVVVFIAGALQFTAWKEKQLECCRPAPVSGEKLAPDARTAWQQGTRLGRHCVYCCGSLIAILLVIGVMDLWVMAAIMAAISLERLAPRGDRVARAIGVVVLAAGLLLIARTL